MKDKKENLLMKLCNYMGTDYEFTKKGIIILLLLSLLLLVYILGKASSGIDLGGADYNPF